MFSQGVVATLGTVSVPFRPAVGQRVVAGSHYDGLGLMDVSNPAKARWLTTHKLDEGSAECLAVVGQRVFATGGSKGLRVFELEADRFVEVARPGADVGFDASRVFAVGDQLWAFGRPEGKDSHLMLLDPTCPEAFVSGFEVPAVPSALVRVGSGVAVGWEGYRAYGYAPAATWSGRLFSQRWVDDADRYLEHPADLSALAEADREALEAVSSSSMNDLVCAQRVGDYLLAAQGQALHTYRVRPNSVFAASV